MTDEFFFKRSWFLWCKPYLQTLRGTTRLRKPKKAGKPKRKRKRRRKRKKKSLKRKSMRKKVCIVCSYRYRYCTHLAQHLMTAVWKCISAWLHGTYTGAVDEMESLLVKNIYSLYCIGLAAIRSTERHFKP